MKLSKNFIKKIKSNRLLLFSLVLIVLYLLFNVNKTNSQKFIIEIVEGSTNIRFIKKEDLNTTNIPKERLKNIIIVNNESMFDKMARGGQIGFAESYMDKDWDAYDLENIISKVLEKKSEILDRFMKNSVSLIIMEINAIIKTALPQNTIKSVVKNVSYHYDIGNDLYSKMLGKHMQYTCAYFHKPNMTLDEAQYAKMELVAKKLNLKPGMRVLDIGCGFGSMAQHLAKKYKVKVTGVTLSKEQIIYANKKFPHKDVSIELKDYRHVEGKFDRVYSIGMFEQVGRKNYYEYYDKCYDLLTDDGIMMIHTIGNDLRKWVHNGFINKYIFPGGEIPHIENLTGKFIDKWHLEDVQNFGISYAKTLRNWKKNIGNWEGLDSYDERFRRMWNIYLLGCAAAFRNRDMSLWQLVYVKKNTKRPDNLHHIRLCK